MELIENLMMDYAYTIYNSQTMSNFLVLHESHETSGPYIISATMKAYLLVLFLQISADEVVMISVAFLVILFSAQRYGTSKLGLAVGPALFIWFCSLAGVGIYNLVKYDRCVEGFQSYSHLLFLQEEFITCLLSLGGCLLCVTGKVRSVYSRFICFFLYYNFFEEKYPS